MRKLTTLIVLLAASALTVSAAYAGPGCGAHKKAAKAKAASPVKSALATDGFPAMLVKVGDEIVDSREMAGKMSGEKAVFLVGEEEFVSEAKAMSALAAASEEFVERFVAISCIVDGKVILCSEFHADAKKACGDMAKKAAGCGSKADKKGCGKMAKAGGKDCCKDSKGCTEAKKANGTCCSSKKGKAVKADGKGCGKKAKAGGEDCCKKGKIAKAGGKDCHAAGETKAVKAKDAKTKARKAESRRIRAVNADGKGCGAKGKDIVFLVAGRKFKSKDAAIEAHGQVVAAIQKIRMTYLVDGEKVHCSTMIDDKAKTAGKVKYVVGESKIDCPTTARVELAKAQYEAAKGASGKLVAKAL